jgi:hypothetical protein
MNEEGFLSKADSVEFNLLLLLFLLLTCSQILVIWNTYSHEKLNMQLLHMHYFILAMIAQVDIRFMLKHACSSGTGPVFFYNKPVKLYYIESGVLVEMRSRPVARHTIQCLEFSPPFFTLEVHCGGGFMFKVQYLGSVK